MHAPFDKMSHPREVQWNINFFLVFLPIVFYILSIFHFIILIQLSNPTTILTRSAVLNSASKNEVSVPKTSKTTKQDLSNAGFALPHVTKHNQIALFQPGSCQPSLVSIQAWSKPSNQLQPKSPHLIKVYCSYTNMHSHGRAGIAKEEAMRLEAAA